MTTVLLLRWHNVRYSCQSRALGETCGGLGVRWAIPARIGKASRNGLCARETRDDPIRRVSHRNPWGTGRSTNKVLWRGDPSEVATCISE